MKEILILGVIVGSIITIFYYWLYGIHESTRGNIEIFWLTKKFKMETTVLGKIFLVLIDAIMLPTILIYFLGCGVVWVVKHIKYLFIK